MKLKTGLSLLLTVLLVGCIKEARITPEIMPLEPKDVGDIKGLVYEADAASPISGVMVVAYDKYGCATGYSRTDMHGRYEIRNLPFGEYILQIRSGELYGTTQRYAGEYYKNAYDWREAGVIPVKTTKPVSSVNFLLQKGGALRGKMIDVTSGDPIAGNPFFLMAYRSKNSFVTYLSSTDSVGEYVITGLEPGSYLIKIEPEGWIGGFHGTHEDWDSISQVDSWLDTVVLSDFETDRGGVITGKISSFVPGLMIKLKGRKKSLQKAVDSTGSYEICGLPEDQYVVSISPPRGSGYAWGVHPTQVRIASGDTVSCIDFELIQEGVISGAVKDEKGLPVEEFDVVLYDVAGKELISGSEVHLSGGMYEVHGIPEGQYVLRITSFSPRLLTSYITEYYGSACCFEKSTPVDVKAGCSTSGIDFVLEKAGWVEGFVFLNNESLSSEDVTFRIVAFSLETGETSVSRNTFCGGYRISGLAPGEYKLCAFCPNSEFAAIWIGGGRTFDDPRNIVIKIEEGKATNADLSVTPGRHRISGKVCDAVTKRAVCGKVVVYNSDGHIVQSAETDNGGYVLNGLGAGKYFVRTYKFLDYRDKWYKDNDVTDDDYVDVAFRIEGVSSRGRGVEIQEGVSITGIDFYLEKE
jgi:hypothetical protein